MWIDHTFKRNFIKFICCISFRFISKSIHAFPYPNITKQNLNTIKIFEGSGNVVSQSMDLNRHYATSDRMPLDIVICLYANIITFHIIIYECIASMFTFVNLLRFFHSQSNRCL
eukprot:629421_1